jgi:copper(I)-binding protein
MPASGALRKVSPISVIAVVAAAAAVAVVAALQREDAGRLSVRDAWAAVDPADPGALRIYLTLVNDGGDDRVVGLDTPLAATVELVRNGSEEPGDAGAGAAETAGGLAMPADSALTLDPDGPFILAREVAWDRLDDAGFPLVLDFAGSDAIFVAVPLGEGPDAEP